MSPPFKGLLFCIMFLNREPGQTARYNMAEVCATHCNTMLKNPSSVTRKHSQDLPAAGSLSGFGRAETNVKEHCLEACQSVDASSEALI